MKLNSSNKIETNKYELEVSVTGDEFKKCGYKGVPEEIKEHSNPRFP